MSEWQPIETAPKDGTKVLGYLPYSTMCPVSVMQWIRCTCGKDTWATIPGHWHILTSHWMPLPEPPKEEL